MPEIEVGKVEKYFAKIGVAAVELSEGALSVGDRVKFRGHTTDFDQMLDSMQIENESVENAPKGSMIGIKVKDRVRPGDTVFKLLE
jgi:putative protease